MNRTTARTLSAALLPGALSLALAGTASAQALNPPPAPAANPTTPQKAVLGKILFWDEQLSSDGTIACGTCHIPSVGGGDPRGVAESRHPGPDGVALTADDIIGSAGIARSTGTGEFEFDPTFGHGAQVTDRSSPSNITAAYFPLLFWDGRADGSFEDPLTGQVVIPNGGALEAQSLDPLISTVEMGYPGRSWSGLTDRLAAAEPLGLATNHPADTVLAMASSPTYPDLFAAAFGTPEITPVRIAFALAAYQRTLVPNESKFDRVMRGQANFTQAENRGFGAFRSNGSRCNRCHQPPLFSDGSFRNLGLRPIAEDMGRREVTGVFQDGGRFKVPSLRNVALRDHFFHTGREDIQDLNDVLVFYDQDGGNFAQNKDPLLNNLTVPPQVRGDLTAFLNTLTDPRVAAETAPFDRPTLWSERATPNPLPLGVGAVFGTTSFTPPQALVSSPAGVGNAGFRVGLSGALPGAHAHFGIRFRTNPLSGSIRHYIDRFRNVTVVDATGSATWVAPEVTDPVLAGVVFQGQWLVRDPSVPADGIARSEFVLFTVE